MNMVSLHELSHSQAQDPLVQVLVQDVSFISAVRDGALHSAALAAVRLLKPQLNGGEFKRPADRRTAFSEPDGLEGHHTTRHAATSPVMANLALQRQLPDPRSRELMRVIRQEALMVEDLIPWTAVRRTWRNKRSNWRRSVKVGELVPEMAARLKELRVALLTDEGSGFAGCGQAWRVQLDACLHGRGTHHSLSSVWEELKASIKAWLRIHDKPTGEPAAAPAAPVELHESGVRAVRALQAAVGTAGEGNEAAAAMAVLQVPLESILNHSREELAAVQQAIEYERHVAAAAAAGGHGSGAPEGLEAGGDPPLISYFSSIHAGWDDSEYDSGAAESDCGSDVTDMDSDFD